MRIKRANKMMNEPPQIMLTDLAFNLLIFFVVCASTEPETGRKQSVPSSSKDQTNVPQAEQNLEVSLTRATAAINGEIVALPEFEAKMKQLLTGKAKPEQRLVVVKSSKDTPYHHWIRVTGMIEQAGGVIAVLVEETRTTATP
jgi:biopolymer transport protein ExbD